MNDASSVNIRPVTPDDMEACGRILYEAFKDIAVGHRFEPDFPTVEAATNVVQGLIDDSSNFGVVAESDGQLVGSCFLSEKDPIRAVGPISVDPRHQGRGIGRRLMEAVIERGHGGAGIRLTQDAFNASSMSLYASLGFEVKEPLVLMEGTCRGELPSGMEVRPMQQADVSACTELCARVYGAGRIHDLQSMPPMIIPIVALREGRIVAYATGLNFWPLNHAVAEHAEDMQALLLGARTVGVELLTFLLPIRQAGLFRWCLNHGLRVRKPMTLMALGEYREPRGCYLPSVGY
ncbi:MAG TPA: GNAT family N-acetyltransferase [Hyalangium sp.]|nr:GNAT family N-acetyltransferase [Hyalangium sp.]